MFKGGYMGKVLRVNLTTQSVSEESLPEKVARDFMGGAGFVIKYLYDEVPAGTDPLGPDNKLIFASGPLSGTNAPCASRMAVAFFSQRSISFLIDWARSALFCFRRL